MPSLVFCTSYCQGNVIILSLPKSPTNLSYHQAHVGWAKCSGGCIKKEAPLFCWLGDSKAATSGNANMGTLQPDFKVPCSSWQACWEEQLAAWTPLLWGYPQDPWQRSFRDKLLVQRSRHGASSQPRTFPRGKTKAIHPSKILRSDVPPGAREREKVLSQATTVIKSSLLLGVFCLYIVEGTVDISTCQISHPNICEYWLQDNTYSFTFL